MNYLDDLREQFNGHIVFREKRPGILQVFAPLFHEDGDMVDMFLDMPSDKRRDVRISDHGLTLMRLSYSYELDTPNKLRIFYRILSENNVQEENGTLFLDTPLESLYPAILQFAQTIAKVSNIQLFRREVIQSLFIELLHEFVEEKLGRYGPRLNILPVPDRDDLEFQSRSKSHLARYTCSVSGTILRPASPRSPAWNSEETLTFQERRRSRGVRKS